MSTSRRRIVLLSSALTLGLAASAGMVMHKRFSDTGNRVDGASLLEEVLHGDWKEFYVEYHRGYLYMEKHDDPLVYASFPEEADRMKRFMEMAFTPDKLDGRYALLTVCKIVTERAAYTVHISKTAWAISVFPGNEYFGPFEKRQPEGNKWTLRYLTLMESGPPISSCPQVSNIPMPLASKIEAYFGALGEASSVNAKRAAGYFETVAKKRWLPRAVISERIKKEMARLIPAIDDFLEKDIDNLTYEDYLSLIGVEADG